MSTQNQLLCGVEKTYFDFLSQGDWRIPRCDSCTAYVFYPREICPHCGGEGFHWVKPSGAGSVYSTSTVYRSSDAGGNYNVSLIDLDEGVRMMSRVDGPASQAISIGSRVKAKVVRNSPAEANLVVFEVVRGAGE